MIGLGDIVIPGIYVAMMLRFDYLRMLEKLTKEGTELVKDSNGEFCWIWMPIIGLG